MAASILAAGAVYGSFLRAGASRVEPVMVDDVATNVLLVEFDFLKSVYRVTVEIAPDVEPKGRT